MLGSVGHRWGRFSRRCRFATQQPFSAHAPAACSNKICKTVSSNFPKDIIKQDPGPLRFFTHKTSHNKQKVHVRGMQASWPYLRRVHGREPSFTFQAGSFIPVKAATNNQEARDGTQFTLPELAEGMLSYKGKPRHQHSLISSGIYGKDNGATTALDGADPLAAMIYHPISPLVGWSPLDPVLQKR